MSRPIAMIASIAIALLYAPVALERRMATVESVVAELARKSGRDLRIKTAMEDEFIFIDLQARPADDLMRLLANATSSEWFEDGGHTWLGRAPGFERNLAGVERVAAAAQFESWRTPLLAPDDAIPWKESMDPVTQALEFLNRRTAAEEEDSIRDYARVRALSPSGRLMSRLIRALPANEVAEIPIGATARYTLDPNRRQRALPGGVASVRQYLEERRAFADSLSAVGSPVKARVLGSLMVDPPRAAAPTRIPTVLLKVTRSTESVSAYLSILDSNGDELDRQHALIAGTDPKIEAEIRALPSYSRWKGKTIRLSPECQSLIKVGPSSPPSPNLALKLKDPLVQDLLVAIFCEPFEGLKDEMGREMIVAVPDSAIWRVAARLAEETSWGTFVEDLENLCSLRAEDGVMVGRSRHPVADASIKTRRKALRDLFRDFSHGIPRLSALARYALAQNPESGATWFEEYATNAAGFGGVPHTGLYLADGRASLRGWGGLSIVQQETLERSGSIAVSSLPSAAQKDIERWLFDRPGIVERTLPGGGKQSFDATLFVDGLPSGAKILCESILDPIVGSRGTDGYRLSDMRSLGGLLARQERGVGLFPTAVNVAKELFVPGTRREYRLALDLGKGLRARFDLEDVDLNMSLSGVGYLKLPPSHLDRLRERYEATKNPIRKP